MTILGLLEKVKRVNLPREVPRIISDTKGELIRLNREQLFRGIDSEGERLAPYRSLTYAIEKNKKNPLPGFGFPDLYLTGAFYEGFYAQVKGGKSILYGSLDTKAASLEADYGKEIFGLTRDNRKVYATGVFYRELRQYISLTTGLKFT